MNGDQDDTGTFTMVPRAMSADPRVTDRDLRLYCVIDTLIGGHPKGCWEIGRKALAAELRTSLSSLDRSKRNLRALRWLKIEPVTGPEYGDSWHRYHPAFPTPGAWRSATLSPGAIVTSDEGGSSPVTTPTGEFPLQERELLVQDSGAHAVRLTDPTPVDAAGAWASDLVMWAADQWPERSEAANRQLVADCAKAIADAAGLAEVWEGMRAVRSRVLNPYATSVPQKAGWLVALTARTIDAWQRDGYWSGAAIDRKEAQL